ncbi:MAG: hypothetical protein JSS60_01135 [Verrucomicrobia bacterium]|nr:hypothetical protein [Verrucomicrobiota bacterium]
MNRSKRSISLKLRKKMTKAIRNAQTGLPSIESRRNSDEMTAKELSRMYPKRGVKKKEELLNAVKKSIMTKRTKTKKSSSKRTTPGKIPADTSPAYPHREGKRWIKTLTKQTLAQRAIEAHRGRKK